jgi:hypothetical protein
MRRGSEIIQQKPPLLILISAAVHLRQQSEIKSRKIRIKIKIGLEFARRPSLPRADGSSKDARTNEIKT